MNERDSHPSLSMTSTRLLDGLRDPANRAVWQDYVDRYRPLLVRYGLRLGLSTTDAEDAAQQTLAEFCTAYQADKYDRQRGRLRDWLFGIARNQIRNLRRREGRGPQVVTGGSSGTDLLDQLPDDDRLTALWDDEWRTAVLQQCLATVRAEVQPTTFEAFELFACQGLPAEHVAERLGITANAVFGAKRRVLHRVRELLPQVDESW